jgi:hypothetical protein
MPGKRKRETANKDTERQSRYFGVNWNKQKQRWQARITVERQTLHLGYFDEDELAAARAFDRRVLSGGLDRVLNFPDAPEAAGHTTTKSRHCGVHFDKRYKTWKAAITLNSKSKHLGTFAKEDDAGRAYDDAIRKYFPVTRPRKWRRFNIEHADRSDSVAPGIAGPGATGALQTCRAADADIGWSGDEEDEAEEETHWEQRRVAEPGAALLMHLFTQPPVHTVTAAAVAAAAAAPPAAVVVAVPGYGSGGFASALWTTANL